MDEKPTRVKKDSTCAKCPKLCRGSLNWLTHIIDFVYNIFFVVLYLSSIFHILERVFHRRDPSPASAGGVRKGGGDLRGEDGVVAAPPSTDSSIVVVGQRMAAGGHVRLLRVRRWWS
jgi:hypothetical protein